MASPAMEWDASGTKKMRDRSSFCVNPVDGIIFQSCWTSGGFVHL
jgi:hypothetical protein